MNRAFFPSPKSPSFCSLHAKASAALFPFHSACRLREGDAVPRLSSKHKIRTNDTSHCLGVGLVLALADGWAGFQIWLTYLACRLSGRGCLRAAQFPPHPEGWHQMPKYSRTEVRDYRNAGLRVRGILLVCFSEFIFCLPLCKISKAVWLNTWGFLFVFPLRWFSFPRAIFSFNK